MKKNNKFAQGLGKTIAYTIITLVSGALLMIAVKLYLLIFEWLF